jgi:hypothetical protein
MIILRALDHVQLDPPSVQSGIDTGQISTLERLRDGAMVRIPNGMV